MDSLNDYVREYSIQLNRGHIQKAYRGIMTAFPRRGLPASSGIVFNPWPENEGGCGKPLGKKDRLL